MFCSCQLVNLDFHLGRTPLVPATSQSQGIAGEEFYPIPETHQVGLIWFSIKIVALNTVPLPFYCSFIHRNSFSTIVSFRFRRMRHGVFCGKMAFCQGAPMCS